MSVDYIVCIALATMAACIVMFIADSLLMRKRVTQWDFPMGHTLYGQMAKHKAVADGVGKVFRVCCYLCTVVLALKMMGVP